MNNFIILRYFFIRIDLENQLQQRQESRTQLVSCFNATITFYYKLSLKLLIYCGCIKVIYGLFTLYLGQF